jgi:arginyl-tRNA synthetase
MIEQILSQNFQKAVLELYGYILPSEAALVQKTRPDFEGDYTIVVFPILKISKKLPDQTAEEIGNFILKNMTEAESFNVMNGFLNISISLNFWIKTFEENKLKKHFGISDKHEGSSVVVEYSSPNTNKPLHLGHIRNNLLGWSLSEILKANGKNVAKVNLVNDRGIHICKSMLAWQKWGDGKTPENENKKGDKLVGDFYVRFDKEYKSQIVEMINAGYDKDKAILDAPLIIEAKEMLKKWEEGDEEVIILWKKMNGWVYEGFDETYSRMGIDFDKIYHESETYLLGKKLVEEGLKNGVLYKKEDDSVWCDLTNDGLDEKLLLRADGTSVYMTQDLGTAQLRFDDYHPSDLIYVVGNEQNYHFDVLKLILKKLGKSWADHIFHLSYGMVELPFGKMKSREGTVVDADDLMDEMYDTAKRTTEELGKFDDFAEEESDNLYKILSLGALKYFILKVDPRKTILFNPAESIDFNGNTGPFIQYTHARIKSVLRKADELKIDFRNAIKIMPVISVKEKNLVKLLYEFPQTVSQAADNYSPALVANYVFELAQEYNQFYHEFPILKESSTQVRQFRLGLSAFTGNTIKSAMSLLGIVVPERM